MAVETNWKQKVTPDCGEQIKHRFSRTLKQLWRKSYKTCSNDHVKWISSYDVYHVGNETNSLDDSVHCWYSFYSRNIYNSDMGKGHISIQTAPEDPSGQEVNTYSLGMCPANEGRRYIGWVHT